MNPQTVLSIDGGSLRPLIETDIHDAYVSGLNNPKVNQYLDSVRISKQTIETVKDFVSLNRLASDAILWGIWLNKNDSHIGTVRLHNINHNHGTANIGICIFDMEYWGKGLGSESVKAVTKWAIKYNDLRWIEAGIFEANIPSIRMFKSSGFEWSYDIKGKFIYEELPTTVKVYVAHN